MTKEEALEFIAQSVKSDVDMAKVADAIEALEQEPVIDKIRAEIVQKIIPRNTDQYDYEAKWQNMGLGIALKVIDKYKAEGSDKE